MGTEKKLKQEKHFVVFLDILGYADLIKTSSIIETDEFLNTFNTAINNVLKTYKTPAKIMGGNYKDRINLKIFSDNILISFKCYKKNIDNIVPYIILLGIVSGLQFEFLQKHNILLRGGIARGMFYRGEEYVFGKALVDAYELEQQACYPRIILEKSEINIMQNEIKKNLHSVVDPSLKEEFIFKNFMLSKYIVKDNDTYFVNTLQCKSEPNFYENGHKRNIFKDDRNYNYGENVRQAYIEKDYSEYQEIKNHLIKNINKYGNYDDIIKKTIKKGIEEKETRKAFEIRRKIMDKHIWLIDYFNLSCSDFDEIEDLIINYNLVNDKIAHMPRVETIL